MDIQNDDGSAGTVGNLSGVEVHGPNMDKALAICARQLLNGTANERCAQEALVSLTGFPGIDQAVLVQIVSYHAEDFRGRWRACAMQGGYVDCKDGYDYLRLIDEDSRRALEKERSCKIAVRPSAPEFQQYFAPRDVHTLLLLPLAVCGNWWGLLCIESRQAEHHWTIDQVHRLETVAALFSVFYERQHMADGYQERDKLSGALEMAGTVCHKLNQPMQVILGYASMVTSGDISEPDQIKEVVQLIEDETRQMGIITKNLMGITKNRGDE
ncbi:MAG: histidine kinase dimerization/phospho-acceptor domain-containing protein [Desulfobacteraceae bacterium]|nr:histidine kinase dimerization/phospho-acceptor domain-containing protein [Desulfobacteraceae bacterium]